MFANGNKLWLVRCFPEGINRIDEFLDDNIIAIGWKNLNDLSGKVKNCIISELTTHGYSASNVTVGVLNYFVNNICIGDICLIPNDDSIYLARVESDYFFDSTKINDGYPHQRTVTYLNKDNPINRHDLPLDIQRSLGARNTIADFSHRISLLEQFLAGEEIIDSQTYDLQAELNLLLPRALENIKKDIESDDPTRRFNASIEVIKLIQNYG